MPALSSYDYAILRVVPNVEREELINVGVILFCRTLQFLGARVELDAERLAATADEIRAATGAEVLPLEADLTEAAQIQHLVEETLRRYSRIDVLVTNNGGPPAGFFDDFDDESWLMAHQLTLLSAVRRPQTGVACGSTPLGKGGSVSR